MKIALIKQRGFAWQSDAKHHCKGYATDNNGSYLDASGLQALIKDKKPKALSDILTDLNGCFCLVSEDADTIFAAVDRVRSFPLFYAIDDQGDLLLSDDAFDLKDRLLPETIDNDSVSEFLLTGYVCGADTIYSQIRQLLAGEYLVFNKNTKTLKLNIYYRYIHPEESKLGKAGLLDAMHDMHKGMAQRLIQSLNGRPVAIPLSGGYDSRLIASLLKEAGYDNIVCFSYGDPKSAEVLISKAAADHLKLPWRFAAHDRESWFAAYQSSLRKDFYRYATHLSASAHIQDWLAVKDLKAKALLPDDSIFIPGHSGDFLEGSHLPLTFENVPRVSRYALIQAILNRHFRLWDWKDHYHRYYPVFREKLCQSLDIPAFMNPEQAASLFEEWDLRERQAKFINNSVRVYEFFGSEWRLCLWDNAMLDFWASVPMRHRMGRKLFLDYAQSRLNMPVPVYTGRSLSRRVFDKVLRCGFGNLTDSRYGRFLDYSHKLSYLRSPIASLCREDLEYPLFIRKKSLLLRADINAIQALMALKEWKGGSRGSEMRDER
ncbi:MAG: asparagine synthetase B family protein [Candidatus Cloacimonadaceae bacterium]|nr:asparagine synthetase B family protein [Candidatus Cloacimonadaceae bacterium]